jgi:Ca-activated chloride channel family protein
MTYFKVIASHGHAAPLNSRTRRSTPFSVLARFMSALFTSFKETDMKPTFFPALILTALLLAACADTTKESTPGKPAVAPQTTLPSPPEARAEAKPETRAISPAPAESAPLRIAPSPSPQPAARAVNSPPPPPAAPPHASRALVKPIAKGAPGQELRQADLYRQLEPAAQRHDTGRERYGRIDDNPVRLVAEAPVSTFSVDVDTGSYANVRRMLMHGQWPPADAVRVEEMINYFPYRYAQARDDRPFAVHTALAPAPWNGERLLLRVALKGRDLAKQTLPPANLVFLVDVSGSMNSPDKLPLLQSSLKLLTRQLRAQDRISLVTYAGSTAVVLSGASGGEKAKIDGAIEGLRAGGSTAGAAGIELAYRQAREHFIDGGINRILLATDGDFNVGVTDFDQLKRMIEEKRKSGVSFTTLGFGTGNYNEHMMEQLADAGNGAYSYIDSLMEGKKVLVNEMTSTLATIARDVKIQIEFNPARVKEYRLIGYENRLLRREDFNNDKVDAGEIGAGHAVTAIYELTPAGRKGALDPLRYQTAGDPPPASDELAFVKLRYKEADKDRSVLVETPVSGEASPSIEAADDDFRLAAAVAGFGQLLRGRADLGSWTYADARTLAATVKNDEYGYGAELVKLIDLAGALER